MIKEKQKRGAAPLLAAGGAGSRRATLANNANNENQNAELGKHFYHIKSFNTTERSCHRQDLGCCADSSPALERAFCRGSLHSNTEEPHPPYSAVTEENAILNK